MNDAYDRWIKDVQVCTLCPISDHVTHKVIDPNPAPEDCSYMVISEGPGYTEDCTGTPFVGAADLLLSPCGRCVEYKECFKWFLGLSNYYKADDSPCLYPDGRVRDCGQEEYEDRLHRAARAISYRNDVYNPRTAGELLAHIMHNCDLWRWSTHCYRKMKDPNVQGAVNTYVLNVVACRPSVRDEDGRVHNRAPNKLEMKNCRDNVARVVQIIKPKMIIVPGTPALTGLMGKDSKITSAIATFRAGNDVLGLDGVPLVPILHPSALTRLDPDELIKGKEESEEIIKDGLRRYS